MTRSKRGLVIGKFLPPHLGHKYLIDFANHCVDELTVLVCTLQKQPIPGVLRYEWMRRSFGGVRVIHHPNENPEEPKDADTPEQFWAIWRESILSYLDAPPDLVFASEPYGATLAEVLGARYIPVDHSRELVPISGTTIREDFALGWEYLLPAAKPYFVRRVAIIGPESSGKSVLAKRLAAHYGTKYVAEYARAYLDTVGSKITAETMITILHGHRASEDALADQCSGLLFCDTEAIVTNLWSRILLGEVPAEIEQQMEEDRYDLYLVTEATQEWVKDPQRFLPDFALRSQFTDDCILELERRGRRYVLLSGNWEQRMDQAVAAIEALHRQQSAPTIGIEGAETPNLGN